MAHDGAADEATTAPLLASTEKPRRNMYAFACATLASMTTILMGYNLALMSGAQLFIREDLGLTDEQVEVLAGSMNVYMLVSILAAGWTADLLGRRGTLVLANGFLMAGALAMSLGGSYAALMVARFVTSIGVGFALVVAPVYNAEISPASVRGVLSSLLDQEVQPHEGRSSKSRERDRGREKDRERDVDHGRDRERGREKDRERDRGDRGDRDRHHREHRERSEKREHRERSEKREHRERSEKREHRGRSDDHDRHQSRDRDVERRDRDRDGHRRHRSRSRSKGRDRRSRSRSRSRSKSKRVSGFDQGPSQGVPMVTPSAIPGQLPAVAPLIPGMLPNMFNFTAPAQFNPLAMQPQAMTQQATRHARRVYVGGLPPTANEQTVAIYFNQVMAAIGGNTAGPGDAVLNVYINHDKKFAFVEMRSVEEASNAMALDGIMFEGAPVKVRRPTDYNPSLAAALGPSQPNPNLNLGAVGLTPGSAGGLEGPDRIFVGGLPYYFTEAQVRELLESFGPLRGFDLVKDRETGNSKGYAFCVYQDLNVTDIACAALNGIKMGDKTLTVRRANQGTSQPRPEQETILLQAHQQLQMQKIMLQVGGAIPTKVVCLTQVVSPDELRDDEEYEDILEDMREEGRKYVHINAIAESFIFRPHAILAIGPNLQKTHYSFSVGFD